MDFSKLSKIITLSIIMFVACFVKSDEIQPGLRMAIRDSAIQSFEEYFLPQLFNNFSGIPLPDNIWSTHVDFLGNITVVLTSLNFKFDKINPNQIKVAFNNNNTISVFVNNLQSNINFDYVIKSNFYNNKGHGNAGFKNLSFILQNKVFAIPNKRLSTLNQTILGPGLNIDNVLLNSINVEINFDNTQPLEYLIIYLVNNLQPLFIQQVKS